ncbi:MAG: hypothetical protein HKN23_20780, partial [Verrucomicrobiales bacterium]|nr:hypothetical protein [Verrucomicrobiales bacterium]
MDTFLQKLKDGWEKFTRLSIVQRVAGWSVWKRIGRFIKWASPYFNTPKFYRFEIVWMRILFALVVFQSMPLDQPYSNWAFYKLQEIKPEWFEQLPGGGLGKITDEANNRFRPPLLPVMEM